MLGRLIEGLGRGSGIVCWPVGMGRSKTRKGKKKVLKTIRCIPDDLWMEVQPLLPKEKKPGSNGRPVVPFRKVLDGILYVLRTGCQWKMLPAEYGSGSTCHRRFQEWVEKGVFQKLWVKVLERYDELKGIRWEWQSLDSLAVKAPLGGSHGSQPDG